MHEAIEVDEGCGDLQGHPSITATTIINPPSLLSLKSIIVFFRCSSKIFLVVLLFLVPIKEVNHSSNIGGDPFLQLIEY